MCKTFFLHWSWRQFSRQTCWHNQSNECFCENFILWELNDRSTTYFHKGVIPSIDTGKYLSTSISITTQNSNAKALVINLTRRLQFFFLFKCIQLAEAYVPLRFFFSLKKYTHTHTIRTPYAKAFEWLKCQPFRAAVCICHVVGDIIVGVCFCICT